MQSNLKVLKKHRIYSKEFKLQLVHDFESGKFSVPQLEKLYGISNTSIYSWIHKFSTFNEKGTRIVEMKESSSKS
jgi:transposase-like protein